MKVNLKVNDTSTNYAPSKRLNLRALFQVIVMIGASAHITGHVIYAHAIDAKLMFIGATAAALGPCVAPLIRSMTSKVLPASERGESLN